MSLKKIIFSMCVFFIACSSAQKNISDKKYTRDITTSNYILFDYINLLTGDDYYPLLDSIKNGLSDDFFTLRMAYTKTKAYDPYDVKFDELRKKISLNIEEKNFKKALEFANKILDKRYIDIKTHFYCTFIYKELNDTLKSNYHYDIYNGLLNSIYFSGDGRSPQTAFIVMEISEEYDLVRWFEMKALEQSLIIEDGYSFDILKVTDENKKTELFFNIDLALKRLSEELD